MVHVLGYVDGLRDGALTGWIAHKDEPNRLATVFCRNAEGAVLPFKPYLPRFDVCSAIGQSGLFGFSIPLAALHALGPEISVTDDDGRPLERGVRVLLSDVASSPAWALLHIQKTAGTSLRSALLQHFAAAEVAFIYPDRRIGLAWDELGQLPWVQRASLRMIMGHMYFGHADCLPGGAQYITFLRDPIQRLRSHYRHHLKHRARFMIDGTERSLEDVVRHGLTDEFDNLITRVIAGTSDRVPVGGVDETHVRLAVANVRRQFRFVGLMDRIEQHYPALCNLMGIACTPLPRENVGETEAPAHGPRGKRVDWEAVAERNRFDRMLCDRLCTERLVGHDLHVMRTRRAAAA